MQHYRNTEVLSEIKSPAKAADESGVFQAAASNDKHVSGVY